MLSRNSKITKVQECMASLTSVREFVHQLESSFKKVWEKEQIPEDWSKDAIFVIAKKGDTSLCFENRRIALRSTAGVFTNFDGHKPFRSSHLIFPRYTLLPPGFSRPGSLNVRHNHSLNHHTSC